MKEQLSIKLKDIYSQIKDKNINIILDSKSQHSSLTIEITSLHNTIQSLSLKINKYNKSNKVIKILTALINKYHMLKIKKDISTFNESNVKLNKIIEFYDIEIIKLKKELNNEKLSSLKNSYTLKCRELVEIISQLNDKPKIGLKGFAVMDEIVSINNENIDSIKEIIDKSIKDLESIKDSMTIWKNNIKENKNYALSEILLNSVDLIGATCIGINSQKRFKDIDFDVAIIDEAGQIQIHNAIVPMSRAEKVIMLGDHKQIPPSVDKVMKDQCKFDDVNDEFLEKSLFEQLYHNDNYKVPDENKVLLDTQYRMPSEIADILSQYFYDGEYKSFKTKIGMKTDFEEICNKPFVVISTSNYNQRFESKIVNENGYLNRYEGEIIISLLKEVFKNSNYSISDIGVISPYKLQVNYIRELIRNEFYEFTSNEVNDLVASLDSFQGQERKVIIYSSTRSNRKSVDKVRIGFLNELRRLNVAFSRCQKQLFFIGDIDFLSSCENVNIPEDFDPLFDVIDESNSEKEFSTFIKLMMSKVTEGSGQLISSSDILERISRGDVDE